MEGVGTCEDEWIAELPQTEGIASLFSFEPWAV